MTKEQIRTVIIYYVLPLVLLSYIGSEFYPQIFGDWVRVVTLVYLIVIIVFRKALVNEELMASSTLYRSAVKTMDTLSNFLIWMFGLLLLGFVIVVGMRALL